MQPITIIDPKDVDALDAKKALDTAKEEVAKKTDKQVDKQVDKEAK